MKKITIKTTIEVGVRDCPFCCCDCLTVVSSDFPRHQMRCSGCGALGPLGDSEYQAVDLWNAYKK